MDRAHLVVPSVNADSAMPTKNRWFFPRSGVMVLVCVSVLRKKFLVVPSSSLVIRSDKVMVRLFAG
ncbi:hypothetical protein D3C78_1667000 [compost metagenome]